RAAGVLAQLRELGVTVSVDDFGTGYSSLARLRWLPIDQIKIDRSFVMNLDVDEKDALVVQTIVDLGRAFGLEVVAEGIESAPQAARLLALGCTIGQGYHYARPLPADRLAAWLHESPPA
ncbi:MAG TPA: EAL domain-containing protein, partial [Rhodocyclaceae bacterium]|nr:EAL domain-containing protein [Rhodocyclaceae bacterium]